jgi:hypothetical protein
MAGIGILLGFFFGALAALALLALLYIRASFFIVSTLRGTLLTSYNFND